MTAEQRPQSDHASTPKLFLRRHARAAWLVCALLALWLYLHGVPSNPPGFFVDESSIAYNAHTIAQTGADEHGTHWPLYFRAFGEYKSPVYIYLLAALFKLTGASIFVARMLSALAGLLAAAALALLAARLDGKHRATTSDISTERPTTDVSASTTSNCAAVTGAVVFVTALLTPWLFEVSRLVFEVALLPLLLALFLLLLHRASDAEDWNWTRAAALAASLALITYDYSGGRLLAPLFALGLALFLTRTRWRGVLRAWLLYGVALLPLFVFGQRHPGALGARFYDVSYITPQSTLAEIAWRFTRNYAGSFSLWSWLVAGDPEPRHHVQTMGSLLAATVALACVGFVLVLLRRRRSAWWRFIIYGLAVSPIPAALTLDHFHTLRLIALPVFLLVFVAAAVEWLCETRVRRRVLALLVLLTLAQGALFQWQFVRAAPTRWHNFDTFYPEVFEAATAQPQRPIYIIDHHAAPGYMHAYWYATLRGMDTRQFVRLEPGAQPPPGALVISTETPCTNCQMILERGPFRAYFAQ